jgi:hypothetical protein
MGALRSVAGLRIYVMPFARLVAFMVPPHVIGGDYVNGKVSLFLNQRVSDN